MKRKYYKYTAEYMQHLLYIFATTAMGCERGKKCGSHKARKRALYMYYGVRKPHSIRTQEFPYTYIDFRKYMRQERKEYEKSISKHP